jgi:hypothetical protein
MSNNDPISVTTNTSWFSRLGSAFGGVLTGLALLVACIGLLAWNEGRSVKAIKANNEGAGAVASVPADRVLPANEGRLIHLTATASAEGQRIDPSLGVAAEGLSLTRKVEYYQWVENRESQTRTKLGGGEETVTTYSYDRQWSSSPEDSSRFQQAAGHENPTPPIKNADFRATSARLGAFSIDGGIIDQVPAEAALSLTNEQAAAAASALSRPARVVEGALYIGRDPATPQVGDMRVTYTVAPQQTTLSVIGAQTSGTIQAYPTRAGSPILMVRTGAASADQMFSQAKASNQTLTWILRGVGVVAMIAACGMVLGPLGVLADVVPLLGSIVRMGAGLVSGVVGLTISLLVIAASWIAFRPLLGLALIGVAAAVVGFLIWRNRTASQKGLAQT